MKYKWILQKFALGAESGSLVSLIKPYGAMLDSSAEKLSWIAQLDSSIGMFGRNV